MKKLLLKVGSFSSLDGQPENLLTVVSELCQKQRGGGEKPIWGKRPTFVALCLATDYLD